MLWQLVILKRFMIRKIKYPGTSLTRYIQDFYEENQEGVSEKKMKMTWKYEIKWYYRNGKLLSTIDSENAYWNYMHKSKWRCREVFLLLR